jgi:hypothetical protein
MEFPKAAFEMQNKASFQINLGKHHFGNAAKCFVIRNFLKDVISNHQPLAQQGPK